MPRFILIDPWLDGIGGHNHQYACDILGAAERSGYQPVMATNRKFESADGSISWPLFPLFDYEASSRYWLGPDGKCRRPVGLDGRYLPAIESESRSPAAGIRWWLARSVGNRDWYAEDRRRRIQTYAHDLQRLFEQIGILSDDVVFLPSLSEFDFLGCVEFLRNEPRSQTVRWHLQFHFDVFSGRSHEYEQQEAARLRFHRQFTTALANIPQHNLQFYNTTSLMAEQYNRVNVATFRPLPYPVSESIHPLQEPFHPGPLRVTCAGVIRREKGREALARLIDELSLGWLDTGRVQLVLQSTRKGLRRVLPARWYQRTKILAQPNPECKQPIVPVAFPLSRDAYRDLIRQADIGLFVYDARRYHARASGVLTEMLAAGVPVLVPAGCWLSDQVAQPNYLYLDDLVARHKTTACVTWTACEQTVAVKANSPSVVLRFWPTGKPGANVITESKGPIARDALTVRAAARKSSSMLAETHMPDDFRFGMASTPLDQHRHFQVTTQQLDRLGYPLRPARVTILAPRMHAGPISMFLKLEPATQQLRVRFEMAYASGTIMLDRAEAIGLSGDASISPAGAVGLIASQEDQVGELLREMVTHYRHYRETAIAFSESWRRRHSPQQTIDRLCDPRPASRLTYAA